MITLGIIANTSKPRVALELPALIEWIDKRGIPVKMADDLQKLSGLNGGHFVPVGKLATETDIILSLGGDGTFLQTARSVAPHQTPILGVNLGGFGYLADVAVRDLRNRIDDILAGRFDLQSRAMIAFTADGVDREPHLALNDIVIDKGGFPRTISLEVSLDGVFLNGFKADGLIIATATGSTGYSLSVGGPILEPVADGLIINPISPHMLANRPLVIRSDRIISVTARSERGSFQVAVDGQQVMSIPSGGTVTVRKADCVTRMVTFAGYDFYTLLRDKLHWRYQAEM